MPAANHRNAGRKVEWDVSIGIDPKCILFLEDVDTFFEEHSSSGLPRTALISLLRRTVESYTGVVLLESKNLSAFDESFRAEIELSVYFAPLHPGSRKKIWQNALHEVRLIKQEVDYNDINKHIEELSLYELNGRQIRSTLALARKVALRNNEMLTWARLKNAAEKRES